jgi:hypothetical protein
MYVNKHNWHFFFYPKVACCRRSTRKKKKLKFTDKPESLSNNNGRFHRLSVFVMELLEWEALIVAKKKNYCLKEETVLYKAGVSDAGSIRPACSSKVFFLSKKIFCV